MDDAATMASAKEDPQAFVGALRSQVIIGEVQRVPELALALKLAVDRERTAGRYLLAGSASVMVLPNMADALVGRMAIHTLWPWSQGEIEGHDECFAECALDSHWEPSGFNRGIGIGELAKRLSSGGYPVALERSAADRRHEWFGSYITTILQRDVRDIASIEGLAALPRLLALLAARAGSLLNQAELSRSLALSQSTLKRYLALLQATFLMQSLPAWSSNLGKRLVKSPKTYLVDTGLLCQLMGLDARRLEDDRSVLGHVLENFVVMELRMQVGTRFRRGLLLYLGSEPLPFGPGLFALPLPAL